MLDLRAAARAHRALAAAALAFVLAVPAAHGQAASVDARVDALLRQMTLEEKVGEMTQLTVQAVSRVRGTADTAQQLDSAKLEHALVARNVGSLLNVWDAALTPRAWQETITAIQRTAARKRLKIPVIYGIDAVHGQNYMTGATLFPHNIAMAATWNPALVRRAHEITAYETRAGGITWNFSPVLDVGRQPLWSRFFETFGEDVHLATVLGREAVLGEQRDPRAALQPLLGGSARTTTTTRAARGARPVGGEVFVAATGKHFLGYSIPVTGRDRTTAWIPERQLREYILPTFQAAIDAGLRTVMINSGDINGEPVHASRAILTDLLRGEMGFTGIAVTDWEDIIKLHTVHRVAATRRDAVRMAVMAGVDMSMVPYDLSFYDDLLALVREGAVPQARIDEAVRRILRVKFELGLFDNPGPDATMLANVGAPAFAAVSRAAAEEAVTLLKNDRGTLPLAKTARVLVTGPGATSKWAMFGSWSYTWQGADTLMYPKSARTFLEAMRATAGAARVTYVPGAGFDTEIDIAAAVAAARDVDVIVVALAERPSTEKPGDISDLTLPAAQLRLAKALEATGKPVILTLFHNRPRIIREVVDSARAVVTAYETGPFGGDALAAVLYGDVNPAGRLPFSWPRESGALIPYDRTASDDIGLHGPTGGYNPEWPFGHGLSYTTFAYSDLRVDRATAGQSDTVAVTVTVANTGTRAGKEVVRLYARDLYASIAPPVARLRDFEKVTLAPGERRTVTFRLPVRRLAFVGLDDKWVVEPGEFELTVGGLTQQVRVRGATK